MSDKAELVNNWWFF